MLIRKVTDLTYADVTPKSLYLDRRKVLRGMGIAGSRRAGGARLWDLASPGRKAFAATKFNGLIKSPFSTTEKQNSYNDVTHYNNFYEFGVGQVRSCQKRPEIPDLAVDRFRGGRSEEAAQVLDGRNPQARAAGGAHLSPPLRGGLVHRGAVDRLFVQRAGQAVEPTSKAKYVAFQSYYDPKQMPWRRYAGIGFPYVEGLRLDEAMHPLALLCVGMYGETLPNQDGAPVRIVLPWKYGFKSIKSLVKIRFVEKQPPTTWNRRRRE